MRDLLAILIAPLLGVAVAGIVFLWWRSPVPTFVMFTALLHGMLLGVGLMWIVQRLSVRSRAARVAMGVLGGVLSVAALAVGQYVDDAYAYHAQKQRAVGGFAALPDRLRDVLADYDASLLRPATGRAGVAGHLALQNRRAAWWPWVRGIEALLIVATPTGLCVVAGGKRAATAVD